MNAPTGIIDIRGKQYLSVALRVQMFRERFPDHGLTTEVVERDPECVVVRASVADQAGRILATGHAEEYRKSSQINRTSALENAETSAIGRALAAFGFGGTEFASANEVQNAIHQQQAGDGQRQGEDQGTVSHPPADTGSTKRTPKHSALKTQLRGFVHELNGCGDGDELSAFLATAESVALLNDLRAKLPHWWDGNDWPEDEPRHEEFVPLADRINQRMKECAQTTVNQTYV